MQRSQKEVRLPSRVYLATLLTIFLLNTSRPALPSRRRKRQACRRNSDTPAEWTKSAGNKALSGIDARRDAQPCRKSAGRGHQWQGQARPWPRSARQIDRRSFAGGAPVGLRKRRPAPVIPDKFQERPGLAKQRSDDGSIDRPQRIDRRTLGVQLGPQTAGETQVTPLSSQG